MDQIAKAAQISRPGLYLHFDSKEKLFRAAVENGLKEDLAEVARLLRDQGRPFQDRLLDSFDRWAGRYVGPMSQDISGVINDNPELLGDTVEKMPRQFEKLIVEAILSQSPAEGSTAATARAQTLISASIGIKYQVADRREYRERLEVAADLLL